MRAARRWATEPARCRCTRAVVATLEATLNCPYAWLEVPGTGWVHTRWRRWDRDDGWAHTPWWAR